MKYLSYAENRTGNRIKNNDFVNYKENSKIGRLTLKVMVLKYIGNFSTKIVGIRVSADLYLEK